MYILLTPVNKTVADKLLMPLNPASSDAIIFFTKNFKTFVVTASTGAKPTEIEETFESLVEKLVF